MDRRQLYSFPANVVIVVLGIPTSGSRRDSTMPVDQPHSVGYQGIKIRFVWIERFLCQGLRATFCLRRQPQL